MRKSMLAGALALVALLTVALDPAMACGRRGGGRFGGGGGFNNGGCYNGGYYNGGYNGGVIYGGYTPYYQPSVEEIPQLTQPVPVEPGTGSAPTAPIQVRDQYGRIYYLVPESQYKKMQPQKEKEK